MTVWLTTLCLILAAEGSAIKGVGAATPSRTEVTSQRTLSEMSLDLNRLLKEEATAKSAAQRQFTILALTSLYQEMMQDDRREEHVFLQNMQAQLRHRLVRVRDELQRQIAREQRKPATRRPTELQPTDEEMIAMRNSLAMSLTMSDSTLASPTMLFSRGGGALTDDNGLALVELIERTINPAFWSTNGGTGTIIYYAPLQCLVVTATGHIHEELGGLLDGVRAVGQ